MKPLHLLTLVFGLMFWTFTHAQETPYIAGDIIIMLNEGHQPNKILEDFQSLDGESTDLIHVKELSKLTNTHLFSFSNNSINDIQLLEVIRKSSIVKAAQFNHIVEDRAIPNDPAFGSQWHHIDTSDNDIDTDLAWDITTGGQTPNGDDIVVCVVEGQGSDYNHPDLIGNHWTNTAEIDGNGIDDDGNGYVDDVNGWNTTSNNDNVGNGWHGTAVSGMIGAKGNNLTGVTGVNWDVKIMQVDMGSLTEAGVIAAYAYPHTLRDTWNSSGGANGAFVVATNSSWGIDNANPASYPVWCAYYDALGASGILNCGATTNNNVNVDVNGDMPTGCSSPYMIGVTATNSSDVRTTAGYGTTYVDLAAPGTGVYLPVNTDTYNYVTGTSFASPCVAGAIALLYSAPSSTLANLALSNPQAAADQVRNAILNGVDAVPNLATEVGTGGRLNVFNSLNLILAGDCGQWYLPNTVGAGPAIFACSAPAGYYFANQDCVQSVVDNDPFCVDNSWDAICQGEYDCCLNSVWYLPNDYTSSGSEPAIFDCVTPAGYTLAANQDCVQNVVDNDPFCMNVDWDLTCQIALDCCTNSQWYIPAVVGDGPAIYDCSAPAGYILADQDCAQSVIDNDPFCVDSSWDFVCQDAYDCCLSPPWYIPATPGDGPAIATCDPPAGYILADQACAQSVIDNDPFCVDSSWDFVCQDAYDCCLSPPWYIPATPGDGPAIATCDPPAGYILADQACAQSVIDNDPFCVDSSWDFVCQDAYDCCLSPPWYIPATPGDGPAIATCDPPAGYILADQACAQSVIDNDPFCVDSSWDFVCQDAYDCCLSPPWYIPATPGDGPAIATCDPPAGYILADQACAQSVIDNDPFCVDSSWDFVCQDAYDCCLSPPWYIPATPGDGPAIATCDPPAGYILADQACAQSVIDNDPFCVDSSWDFVCQDAYDCCLSPPWYIPATPGDGPAIATCDPPAGYILADQACAQSVIDNDPFCVDSSWDFVCQDAYDCCLSPPWYIPATPGDGPAIATCDPPAGYILADQACAQSVIDNDPFCVDSSWDFVCQDAYDCCLSPPWYIPATPGDGPAIATCDPPAGYILADQACAQTIIDGDSFCVDVSWDNLCNAAYSCCTGIGTSCHDFAACNYDSSLCQDNSTCIYPGCTDAIACNYDAAAGCDDGSCTYAQWYIPAVVGDGPAVSACSAPAGYILADQACAQFVIDNDPFCVDTSWDSVCQGSYDCCIGGIVGCTDASACNYDATATCEDGSCTYPQWYIPAVVGDGPAVSACSAPAGYILADQACAQSVIDTDPFCLDTSWDSLCQNSYNCCLGGPVGCTDPTACNYDDTATCDDGTCTYDCTCPGDFDGNGLRNTADLLIFLSQFGCSSACTADMNGDGEVGAADLLAFLSVFGTPCD